MGFGSVVVRGRRVKGRERVRSCFILVDEERDTRLRDYRARE